MDLWGPALFTATNSAKYYITFINNYSHYCTMKLLKNKTEASEKVKEYIAFVKCLLRYHAPMAIQADNGMEVVNNDLQNWLGQHGVNLRLSTPYSLQQNGTAEHYNHTVADLIRAMLIEKNLPKILWQTAALHATYLWNHTYTQKLSNQTPMEHWSKQKPNVLKFQEFGTPVSILDESNTRDKLNAQGNIHIFVGFEDGPDAILHFDVSTHQFKASHNYHFMPKSNNPLQFKGECLEEGKSLWETPSEPRQGRDKQDVPLTIQVCKQMNLCLRR